jgi:hypothetical protein
MSYKDAMREVRDSVTSKLLKFKCPVDDVRPFAEHIPLEEFVHGSIGMYFTNPTFMKAGSLPDDMKRPASHSADKASSLNLAGLAEDAYYREIPRNLTLILPRHNALSNAFASWLNSERYSNIRQESGYVDVVFEGQGKSYRAELKICYGVGSTKAIREALGQLFEYNYYPGRGEVDHWVILLDQRATTGDIEYIRRLKAKHNLPLSLGWRSGLGFMFADGLGL